MNESRLSKIKNSDNPSESAGEYAAEMCEGDVSYNSNIDNRDFCIMFHIASLQSLMPKVEIDEAEAFSKCLEIMRSKA